MSAVDLWTDGSCPANPGHGAWACILVHGDTHKPLGAGVKDTTNNRMELTAVIEGLRALKRPCEVTVHTDSQYVMHGFSKGWVEGWKRRGWRTAARTPVVNRDLWEALDALILASDACIRCGGTYGYPGHGPGLCIERGHGKHRVRWEHVKGHRGVPLNERADRLAAALVPMTTRQEKLLADLNREFDRAWAAATP